jgi:hypothetical protein
LFSSDNRCTQFHVWKCKTPLHRYSYIKSP